MNNILSLTIHFKDSQKKKDGSSILVENRYMLVYNCLNLPVFWEAKGVFGRYQIQLHKEFNDSDSDYTTSL
jgi:hypothetical protein